MQLTAHLDASVLFFGRQPSQSKTPPSLNRACLCLLEPRLLFPTCSNRLQGGFNQVFIARLQALSPPHDRPRRFARQESMFHNKQRELTHEGMQVTHRVPVQHLNHVTGEMKDIKPRRDHVKAHQDVPAVAKEQLPELTKTVVSTFWSHVCRSCAGFLLEKEKKILLDLTAGLVLICDSCSLNLFFKEKLIN